MGEQLEDAIEKYKLMSLESHLSSRTHLLAWSITLERRHRLAPEPGQESGGAGPSHGDVWMLFTEPSASGAVHPLSPTQNLGQLHFSKGLSFYFLKKTHQGVGRAYDRVREAADHEDAERQPPQLCPSFKCLAPGRAPVGTQNC